MDKVYPTLARNEDNRPVTGKQKSITSRASEVKRSGTQELNRGTATNTDSDSGDTSFLVRQTTIAKSNDQWVKKQERLMKDRGFDLTTAKVKPKYSIEYKRRPEYGTCDFYISTCRRGFWIECGNRPDGSLRKFKWPGYADDPVQIFIAGLILLNFLTNAIESEFPNETSPPFVAIFTFFEYLFTILFTVELVWNMGSYFFAEFWCGEGWGWNWFDSLVVVVSIVSLAADGLEAISVLRLLRAFRVFRLFKRLPALNKIVKALERSLPGVGNAFVIMLLIMCIFSILGIELLRQHHPNGDYYFGNFSLSLLTMFQVMTGESWAEAIARPACEGWDKTMSGGLIICHTFFYLYVIIVGFIMVNVAVALLLEKFVEVEETDDKDPFASEEDVIESLHEDLEIVLNRVKKIEECIEQLHIMEREQKSQHGKAKSKRYGTKRTSPDPRPPKHRLSPVSRASKVE